jgi:hypothetical protein
MRRPSAPRNRCASGTVARRQIGARYGRRRREDPLIARRIRAALATAASGCQCRRGNRSCGPPDRQVLAVGKSAVTIAQRDTHRDDGADNPLLGRLTDRIPRKGSRLPRPHRHPDDRGRGICATLADADDLPEVPALDRRVVTGAATIEAEISGEVEAVPVPPDCADGFYWHSGRTRSGCSIRTREMTRAALRRAIRTW